MGDTISRQAAIDTLMEKDKKLRNINWYDKPYAEAECRGIDEALSIISNLPSAQPEPHWIPCGERLPDTNRDVLLQFNTNMGIGFLENGEWGVNTGDNIYSEIGEGEEKPIAWTELPEPYGGEHDG